MCIRDRKYIHFHSRYERYVGVISCDKPGRYKIFLGNSPSDPFFQIGDNSGHGQDHCELVNPNFRITADDDITSACPECDIKTIQVGSLDLENIKGYYRQGFGDDFLCYRNTGRIAFWWDAVNWYECGIELP